MKRKRKNSKLIDTENGRWNMGVSEMGAGSQGADFQLQVSPEDVT